MQNISIKNIYWMLAYAFRVLNEKSIEKLSTEEFENIYELFASILSNELVKQVKRGLHKEYISIEKSIGTVKGKMILKETLKDSKIINDEIFFEKVTCNHDEYSSNSYLNQIIKTAGEYLIKSKKIDNKLILSKLKKSLLYLSEIDTIKDGKIDWNRITYNKNNNSYKILINISHLILDGLLINKKGGQVEFRNYIDDQKMHKLYEKFILEYYRYHFKELKPSAPQVDWKVDEDNEYLYLLPKMQTDITLYSGNRKLIIDAKYYSDMYQNNPLYNKETFKSNNLYQIFTYVKNEDKQDLGNVMGMLMYIKTNNNDEQWAEYKFGKNKVIITNIDFSVDFDTVKNQLNDIAKNFEINKL